MEERNEMIDGIKEDIDLNRQIKIALKDILNTKQDQARLVKFIKTTRIATRQ